MISFNSVTKQVGSRVLYKDASFQINPGDKIGLVGPNGAGKTTIFRILMGEESTDGGSVTVPAKVRLMYFSQDVGEMKGASALLEVMGGAGEVSKLGAELEILQHKLEKSAEEPLSDDDMTKLIERFGEVQHEFEVRGGYDLENRGKEILTGLGIMPDQHHWTLDRFSGGWKMRIALAKVLLANPDVLLMDEPTNHLDVESIVWLEEWLRNFKGALVMTSHDRDFMNRIVKTIIEVYHQKITVYSGDYDYYDREKEIRKTQLESSFKRQQDMLAKEEEFIARFAARASHAAQVQSRVKKIDKIERVELPPEDQVIDFEFNNPPRSGNEVVKIEDLSKTYPKDDGGTKTVFSGANGMVRRLDKIAVVGVNGAGKSTLLKIIMGETEPTTGKATIGANVKIGYFSQYSLDVLNPNNTVLEEVQNRIPNAGISQVRSLLGAFLFSGDDVNKKISVLSGGEKSRVVLATILANPVNFLVLDEPTNHLDIKSREILLKNLKKFDGTIMFVSHDRFFTRELANRVFEIDLGHMNIYPGTYKEYCEKHHLI